MKQNLTHAIEIELSGEGGGWSPLSSDVLMDMGLECNYGIGTPSLTQRIGRVGRLRFILDNSHTNSSKEVGKYTPGHTNHRTGVDIGSAVRWTTQKERGTGDDRTIGSGVAFITDGASFDDTSNANIPVSSNSIENIFSSEGSLSAWYQATSTDMWLASTDIHTLALGLCGSSDFVNIILGSVPGSPRIQWREQSANTLLSSSDDISTTDYFQFGLSWSTDTLRAYHNGIEYPNSASIPLIAEAVTAFSISRNNFSGWGGNVKHFAIWGSILSDDAMLNLAENEEDQRTQIMITASDSSLLRYYPLDEGVGTTALDRSTDLYYKFLGKIEKLDIAPGEYSEQTVKVTVADWMKDASQTYITSLPAQAGKTIDGVVSGYFSDVETLPNETAFETGANVFTYSGQAGGSETALLSELRRLANSEPSRIYMRGSKNTEGLSGGVLVVENKMSRDSTDIKATMQDWLVGMQADRNWGDVKNDIRTTVHPSIVDTDTKRIYELPDEVEVPANQTLTFSGRYRDSDDPNTRVGAYGVSEMNDTDYVIVLSSSGQGYTTDPVTSRILGFGTDLVAFWKLNDTDGLATIGGSDMNLTLAGTHSVGTDGVAGWNYLIINDGNDKINNSNAIPFTSIEKGSMLYYYNKQADGWNEDAVDDYHVGIATTPTPTTTDHYSFALLESTEVPFGEVLFISNNQHGSSSDTANVITTDQYTAFDSDVNNNFIQIGMTWDYHFGSTDAIDRDIYINGVQANYAFYGEPTSDYNPVGAKPNSTDSFYIWEIIQTQHATNNMAAGLLAFFERPLVASDYAYIYNNSTDFDVDYTAQAGGTSPQFTAISTLEETAYIIETNLYGKLLTDKDPITIEVKDTDSIKTHGLSVYNLDMTYQDDAGVARTTAADLLAELKDPKTQVGQITFIANYDSDTADYFLGGEPGDRIAIVEEMTGLVSSDEFIINGVAYKISTPDIVGAKWIVYPV